MRNQYNYDLLINFLKKYDSMYGDGYVELMLSFVMPMLADDERCREYALGILYLITGRNEFKQQLILCGANQN